VGPIDLVNKCNPLIREHKAKIKQILEDNEVIKSKLATIENTRRAVSETTLNNAKQQKANNNRREQLQATKLQIYGEMIRQSLAIVKNKSVASKACKDLPNKEEAHCCLSVIWDGVNPNQCNIELIYQVFGRAGVFGTRVVRPVK
jgi:hypothetical protein